jgi:hypothetical protein
MATTAAQIMTLRLGLLSPVLIGSLSWMKIPRCGIAARRSC